MNVNMDKKIRRKMITLYITIVLTIIIMISSVFAWISLSDTARTIDLSIVKINSSIKLFQANDINYNGVPDRLVTPITEGTDYTYYDEAYDFTYLATDYAKSISTANVVFQIQMDNMMPSKVYTYKLAINNMSDVPNHLSFYFLDKLIEDQDIKDLLSTISIEYGTIEELVETIDGEESRRVELTHTGKTYFFEKMTPTGVQRNNLFYDNTQSGGTDTRNIVGAFDALGVDKSYLLDYWVKFTMEPYDVLKEQYGDNFTITREHYNELQGLSLQLPRFNVLFEVDVVIE